MNAKRDGVSSRFCSSRSFTRGCRHKIPYRCLSLHVADRGGTGTELPVLVEPLSCQPGEHQVKGTLDDIDLVCYVGLIRAGEMRCKRCECEEGPAPSSVP